MVIMIKTIHVNNIPSFKKKLKNYLPSNSSGDKARPPCMCSFSFYQNLC